MSQNGGGRNTLLVTPPSKRISLPASQRLSTIVEGNTGPGGAPQLPPPTSASEHAATTMTGTPPAAFNFSLPAAPQSKGLYNVPASRRYTHGEPPLHSAEKRPPSYSTNASFLDGAPPGSGGGGGDAAHDPFHPDTQNPGWYERLRNRGGWRKILFGLVALLVVAIALGVGLGVGLTMRSQGDSSNAPAPASPTQTATPTLSGPFPIGTWTVDTFLTVANASCVSNAATWNCPPYTPYSASRQASAARFSWVINSTSTPASNSTLTLASVYDPLSSVVVPGSTALRLEAEGTADERFAFSVVLQKKVFPRDAITGDGSTSLCFFNGTVFSGSLYTRRAATLAGSPSSTSSTDDNSNNGWPGAVDVRQSVSGGDAGIPDCYQATGSSVSGPRVAGLSGNGDGTECLCEYQA